jgi:hypothetical protein
MRAGRLTPPFVHKFTQQMFTFEYLNVVGSAVCQESGLLEEAGYDVQLFNHHQSFVWICFVETESHCIPALLELTLALDVHEQSSGLRLLSAWMTGVVQATF